MAVPNLAEFAAVKGRMEEIAAQRKLTKPRMDELQQIAVKAMLQAGLRYIDERGDGTGPFWTLCKDAKEGSWKADRYNDFFTGVLTEMRKGTVYTSEQLTALAQAYLKQFEKRMLKVERHATCRRRDVADLLAWLSEGPPQ